LNQSLQPAIIALFYLLANEKRMAARHADAREFSLCGGSQPFFGPWPIFLKILVDHIAMLTSHEQLVKTVLHIL